MDDLLEVLVEVSLYRRDGIDLSIFFWRSEKVHHIKEEGTGTHGCLGEMQSMWLWTVEHRPDSVFWWMRRIIWCVSSP